MEDQIAIEKKIELKSTKVNKVTVYNDRAEVTRSFSSQFEKKGNYDVIVRGLSTLADTNSVRVIGGSGNATVLEVSVSSKWEKKDEEEKDPSRISTLQKEKKILEKKVARIQEGIERVNKEKKWLEDWCDNAKKGASMSIVNPQLNSGDLTDLKNTILKSTILSTDSLQQVDQFLDFFDKQLTKLDDKQFELTEKMEEVAQELKEVTSELSSLGKKSAPTNEIKMVIVSIYISEDNSEVNLFLSYLIKNAKWSPSYDVRVNSQSTKDQMVLTYYGSITNDTGEDWKDTDLVLSTAVPSLSTPPKLPTSEVKFHYDKRSLSYSSMNESIPGSASFNGPQVQSLSFARSSSVSRESAISAPPPPTPVNVLTTKSTSGTSSSTFSIARKVNIASDNKPHKVTITIVNDLKSRFTYSVIPAKTEVVYLKASAQNTTTDFPFLEGPINIFMDSNFITTSQIKNVNPLEEFALFIGSDSGIKVDRKPVKSKDEGGYLLSKVKYQTNTTLTVIKNTKNCEVAVVVYDQLPLSSDGKIKVTLNDPNIDKTKSDIKLNEFNNIEWRVVIPAGGKIEIPLSYTIEYPKDKEIEIEESSKNGDTFM